MFDLGFSFDTSVGPATLNVERVLRGFFKGDIYRCRGRCRIDGYFGCFQGF